MDYSGYSVRFSRRDQEIMDSYARTVEDLGRYLGSGYELVLHSLADCRKSAVVVVNGFHTGREVGAPITDLAVRMLEKFRESGAAAGEIYFARNQKGEPLKSTTIPVFGEKGGIIGLLCINFYLNSPVSSLIEDLTPAAENRREEAFLPGSESGAEHLMDQLTALRDEVYRDGDIPYNCKNKQIVQRLLHQGAFAQKNAVRIVSEFLGISKNTIYLHIRNAGK